MGKDKDFKLPKNESAPEKVQQSLPDAFVTFCVARDGEYFSIYQLEKKAGEMGLSWKKVVEKAPRHLASKEASLRLFDWASTGDF